MKRFTKAALFLAALAVMAGSAAYAALPTPILHPGDLVGTEDFRLLASGDVSTSYTAGQLGTKFYHTIIAPNVDNPADMNSVDGWWYSILGVNSSADTSAWSLKKTYKSFDIISNVDPEMQQDWYAGSFVSRDQKGGPGSAMYVSDGLGSHSFDLFLIRTTNPTVDLEFHVNQNNGLKVGLMGGFEVTGPKYPGAFAGDCTLGCDNFHHEMHFNSGRFTETDTIHWTGTGDTAYYVECCDKFAMVASNDSGAGTYIPSYSLSGIVSSDYRDMVFAHLSDVPHLRVRVAKADNVLSRDASFAKYSEILKDANAVQTPWQHKEGAATVLDISGDFRAIDKHPDANWQHSNKDNVPNFTRGAVDVPDGEYYNLGVLYTDSSDCNVCGGPDCANEWLPVAAVTNLGVKATDISDNYDDGSNVRIAPWLCNSWCGLCTVDSMMSGDKGSLGDGKYSSFANVGATDADKIKNQSAIYDCVCHIYPAFTNTFKAKGNVDIDWIATREKKTTHITGRVNTSWHKTGGKTGGLCQTCEEDVSYWYPCPCLELYYKNAMGEAHKFALEGELKPLDYTNDAEKLGGLAAGEYGKLFVEFGEGVLQVKGQHPEITLTKVAMKLDGAQLQDAGLMNLAPGEWWRTKFWDKVGLKLNGIGLNETEVASMGSAAPFTAEKLSFLSLLKGPQSPAPNFSLEATDDVSMGLFVFVVDSDEKAIKYFEEENSINTDGSVQRYGNKFLVVYDGAKDNKFTLNATLYKKGGSEPVVFGLQPSEIVLNLKDPNALEATVKAVNVPLGGEVEFSIVSPDLKVVELAPVSGDAFAQVVKALKVGEAKVRAAVKGTELVSEASVVVKDEVVPGPTPHHSGGSSGCSVGFAPAVLLLLAPLAFFKK